MAEIENKTDEVQVNENGTFVSAGAEKKKHTARNVALIVFAVVVVAAIALALIGTFGK